jgi:hypothetical protein
MTSKYKSKKHLTKRNRKSNKKNKIKRTTRNYRKNYNRRNQQGGSSCSLATVQEPAFSIPALGDIPALNIPQAKGVIYRPNCKTDTNQAMVPF